MTSPRWLAAEEQRAWRAYLRMHSQLDAELNRRLQAACGLSLSDYEVLVLLSEADGGRLRPYELQRETQWEQSRLAHQLSRMQKRGLVVREKCTEDGRGSFVVLTPAGRAAIETAAPRHVDDVRRLVFDGLDRETTSRLELFATTVLARLETAPGNP
jgi:DNA-binding MarR family transcriptional regulator